MRADNRTWLFGPVADASAHDAMQASGADVFIADLEDFTRRAAAMIKGFEAARARGEDRALVEGPWIEVPTYRNARRLIARARRLSDAESRRRDA